MPSSTLLLIIAVLTVLLLVFVFLYVTLRNKYIHIKRTYEPIIDVDNEIQNKKKELANLDNEYENLKVKYNKLREVYLDLEGEIKIFRDDIELSDFGIYEPHFDFDTSEQYKEKIKANKIRQKEQIKKGNAAVCYTDWEVRGSKKEGKKMTNRMIKLTLRAFNGECDSLVTKIKWNNIEQTEQRIRKAFNTVNKLNESSHVKISDYYLELKIEEARLTHEYAQKKYDEKEEQRLIREKIREEEKVQREIETAKKKAFAEEKRYQKALEKAQKDLQKAKGEELEKLNALVDSLKQELEDAQQSKERALSRAQQTKSGHVYVISNIGSFGENIYKIGMTRRLEPMDRVKELGDASVPFQFDVHALIYSDNAPELENKLHKEFVKKRVNMVNNRKEYFKVGLKEIENIVKKHHSCDIEFTKIAEAQEYRETLSILKEMNDNITEGVKVEKFPQLN